jgi:hypothetical protein
LTIIRLRNKLYQDYGVAVPTPPERRLRLKVYRLMKPSARCVSAAVIGLAAAIAFALPAAAQPADELPDFLAPDLPPGVERFCGNAIVPDLPPGEIQAVASASEELPPLPEWCDGTCTIDIAFFYEPEAIGQESGPQSVAELRADVLFAIGVTNVAFRHAGLNAELRFVGMERDQELTGSTQGAAILHIRRERLTHARQKYGADLVYAISEDRSACGRTGVPGRDMSLEEAASYAVGAIHTSCLRGDVVAHEVGHNLGLVHNPESHGGRAYDGSFAFVPFGHGYLGSTSGRSYYSIMGPGGASGRRIQYSSAEPLYGRVIGSRDRSDSARALRYRIPDTTRYSPTVIPHRDEDPHSYSYACRLSTGRACLNERRFEVSARYTTSTVSRASARRLDTLGQGDSAALFYFFGPDNPEMLLKVVNGCWLNDHWWVFGSAATDLRYEVAIKDLADEGGTVEYRHNGGGVIVGDNGYSTAAGVINDTSAFPCVRRAAAQEAGSRQTGDWLVTRATLQRERLDGGGHPPRTPTIAAVEATLDRTVVDTSTSKDVVSTKPGQAQDYGCVGRHSSSVCLNNWRFQISVVEDEDYRDDKVDARKVVPTYGLGDSAALLYFFAPYNPEMLLKVVNGCWLNAHWWVFGSAATDLKYSLRIVDHATVSLDSEKRRRFGRINVYDHVGGGVIVGDNGYRTRSGVIADTTAFPCSP